MSIQEDAVWPPEQVDPDDEGLDQTDLAKEQRESAADPTLVPQAALAGEGDDGS